MPKPTFEHAKSQAQYAANSTGNTFAVLYSTRDGYHAAKHNSEWPQRSRLVCTIKPEPKP